MVENAAGITVDTDKKTRKNIRNILGINNIVRIAENCCQSSKENRYAIV